MASDAPSNNGEGDTSPAAIATVVEMAPPPPVETSATATATSPELAGKDKETATAATGREGRDTRTRRASAAAASNQPSTPAPVTRRTRRKKDEAEQEKGKEKGKEKEQPKDKPQEKEKPKKAAKGKPKDKEKEKEKEKPKEADKDREKEKDLKAKNNKEDNETKKDDKDKPKEKETKPRASRRTREKSNASAQNTPQSSRKKPKLEHHAEPHTVSSGNHNDNTVNKKEDTPGESLLLAPAPVAAVGDAAQHQPPAASVPPTPTPAATPNGNHEAIPIPPSNSYSAQTPVHTPVQTPAMPSAPSTAASPHRAFGSSALAQPPVSTTSTPPSMMHPQTLSRSHSLESGRQSHSTPTYQSPAPTQPAPQPSPHRTSGRNYDPIRSAFGDPSPPSPPLLSHGPSPVKSSTSQLSPPPHNAVPQGGSYRASASPAIASIIDPPAPSAPVHQQLPAHHTQPAAYSNHVHGYSSYGSSLSSHYGPTQQAQTQTQTQMQTPTQTQSHVQVTHGPAAPSQSTQPPPQQSQIQQQQQHQHQQQAPAPPPPHQAPPQQPPPTAAPPSQPSPQPEQSSPGSQQHITKPKPSEKTDLLQQPMAMEIDSESASAPPTKATKASKKEKDTPTGSSAPSPKPGRAAKDAPPPLPQGSGLITGALFGVDDSSSSASKTTPNIVLHVPLDSQGNQIISFARLAEEKYGFAALHPRLAAQKERLARVAAASAALEKNEKGGAARESADEDLSVDIDRESDVDGDVAMGGTELTGADEKGDGKKKRRRKKIEDYDRDDPFVDDSEMVWQEQAAASKDGFFVYSGPLIAEGEKVQVERADGTIKRGRGRGRGGVRNRGGQLHVPIASNVPISPETGLPIRGPGSRGGSLTRKPRSNKARQQQQAEDKQDSRAAKDPNDTRGRGSSSRGGAVSGTTASSRSSKGASALPLAPAPGPAAPQLAPAPGPVPNPSMIIQ